MGMRDAQGTLVRSKPNASRRSNLSPAQEAARLRHLANNRPLTKKQMAEIDAEIQAQREAEAYEERLYVEQQVGNGRKGHDPKRLWHPLANPDPGTYDPTHPADVARNRRRKGLFPQSSDVHGDWEGARYAIRHYGFSSRKALGEHFEQPLHWVEKLLRAMAEEEQWCHADGIPGWELDVLFPSRVHTFSGLLISCPYQG